MNCQSAELSFGSRLPANTHHHQLPKNKILLQINRALGKFNCGADFESCGFDFATPRQREVSMSAQVKSFPLILMENAKKGANENVKPC